MSLISIVSCLCKFAKIIELSMYVYAYVSLLKLLNYLDICDVFCCQIYLLSEGSNLSMKLSRTLL